MQGNIVSNLHEPNAQFHGAIDERESVHWVFRLAAGDAADGPGIGV
jgi:hypothetical protein